MSQANFEKSMCECVQNFSNFHSARVSKWIVPRYIIVQFISLALIELMQRRNHVRNNR